MDYIAIIEKYNRVLKEIDSRFIGLPHAHLRLIHTLFANADPLTGLVDDISHRELAMLLTIDPAPGRRGSGMPKKNTVRGYLNTIAEQCPQDFKIVSQGQKLKCLFTRLPEIYDSFVVQNKVHADEDSKYKLPECHDDKDESAEVAMFFDAEDTEEVYRAKTPIKNSNNINKNNNNNSVNEKLPIADNFTPSPETIARATSMGFSFAADFSEIQAFIDHNKATGSMWADFNPIYLRWLAKSAERKLQIKRNTNHSRKVNHEGSHSQTHKPSARERVLKAYAESFELCKETGQFRARLMHQNQHDSHALATAY